jgi:hypothetical protein
MAVNIGEYPPSLPGLGEEVVGVIWVKGYEKEGEEKYENVRDKREEMN